jgi:long-chain acyl-CoA synthetase
VKHPWDQRLGFWWIAEDHPDQPAVVASPSGVTLTFDELAGRAHQLVHALRAHELVAGDSFAFAIPNDVEPLVWQLAAQESGLRSIALNPALSGDEICSILEHSGAKAVVVHQRYAGAVAKLAEVDTIALRIAVGGEIDGFVSDKDLVTGFPTTAPEHRVLGGPIAYSSGTTGQPKGIWRAMPDIDPSVFADAMKSFGHAFMFQPLKGVHLVSAGMHHGGCHSFYNGALNVGQALAIMGKFDAEESLALIERHRVTTGYMVPTQFVRLLRLPDAIRERYDHSSLEVIVHSAAPCPFEIKRQMFSWWGPVIWETYGGMEGAATIAKPHRWLEKPGTVGRPIKGMSIKVLDDEGNAVSAGEVGHVYLEPSDGRFEYRNDPDQTAAVHRGKAFTLGDMGYLDEDGYLFLSDRAKDLIISGGVNIYPAEVEGVLSLHPAVGDVAVIGVPDPEWGESVKAVVELTNGAQPSPALADEIVAFCREQLAGYKCPRSVDFTETLPRTDGGKLMKRTIRDEYWAAAGRKL